MGISFPSIRLAFSFEGVDPHAPLRGPSRTVCSRSADLPAWILISSLPQTPNVAARMKRSPLPTSAGAHADSSVPVRDFSVDLCSSTVDGGVCSTVPAGRSRLGLDTVLPPQVLVWKVCSTMQPTRIASSVSYHMYTPNIVIVMRRALQQGGRSLCSSVHPAE